MSSASNRSTPESSPKSRTWWRVANRQGLLKNSVACYLASLLALFVAMPFIQEIENGAVVEGLLVTVVLSAAVLAVSGRRRTMVSAVVLVAPALVFRWLHHFYPVNATYALSILSFLLFLAFVVGQFFRFILRSPRVDSEVICAALAIYVMLALLWAVAYALLARLHSGSFAGLPPNREPLQGFDAFYFSVITLTTVGYGDIEPVSGAARMLAMLEAMTGTMYMAVLVARLVSVYSSKSTADRVGNE